MKVKTLAKAGIISLVGLVGTCSSIYQIDETEQAVVFHLGSPQKMILGSKEAGKEDSTLQSKIEEWNKSQPENNRVETITSGSGIYLKWPFIQSVEKFDDRLLDYSSSETDVVTLDKKHLLIDTYAKWRIVNPLLFRRTVVTINGATSRLDDNIYSIVREYVGQNNLLELVRSTNTPIINSEGLQVENIIKGKEHIMDEITYMCNEKMEEFGIEIVDVRIRKSDLPRDNAESVYDRMRSERQRIATQYRSEGQEEATKIRAIANRDRDAIKSEAYKLSEETKGEGDAIAAKIYNDSYSKNPQFFQLWKTTEAYYDVFRKDDNTKIILDTDSEFLKYINK